MTTRHNNYNAQELAQALGGHRVGDSWMARCPAHNDVTPSLAIKDGHQSRLLLHCHAGCQQEAVIERLKCLGLWGAKTRASVPVKKVRRLPPNRSLAEATTAQFSKAMNIWQTAEGFGGSLAEKYLGCRGITMQDLCGLRYHSELYHPSGESFPAMIALVTDGVSGEPQAIHRTYLSHDGQAKAPVEASRMMLGKVRNGVVRLADAQGTLLLGEGLETCMSAMQVTGIPAWAALSTTGLQTVELPQSIAHVTILADGDAPGEEAATTAAARLAKEGRTVRIARAPKGLDFNDLLMGRGMDSMEKCP
ncbi:toprim domain-containing protein [Hoeflea alexandrii]|uniref:DUF7146 domain-containing protein n=1 Tax=Hoeflea alexandrii TaxID=288436 RepID=UPI0035CF4FE8